MALENGKSLGDITKDCGEQGLGRNKREDVSLPIVIDRLKQGLISNVPAMVREAHRQLCEVGQPATRLVTQELDRIDLGKVHDPASIRLVVGLAALLHDLDENQSARFFAAVGGKRYAAALDSGLRSVRRFTVSDYRRTRFASLEIFEHRGLPATLQASAHVVKWLQTVPREDLEGITRIYIRDTQEPIDYLGYYLPHLSVIVLDWRTDFPTELMCRLMSKSTLFHEIGHHACRHIEGGQDPEHEREADAYAARMLFKAHPWLGRIAKTVRWLRGNSRNSE